MATINDVGSEVGQYFLHRVDLHQRIFRHCRNVYRTLCQKVPFEELQGKDSINTGIGIPIIDLSATTPDLAGIISLKINYSATSAVRLQRTHVRNYDNMPVPANRKPIQYARYGKTVELWPPPDAVYTLELRYWQNAVIANPIENTVLSVPDAWLELIQWETYYRMLTVLGRHDEAQALIIPAMQPRMGGPKKVYEVDMGIIPRLWNELLTTISQRENIDEDFSINPVRPNA